MGMRSRATLYWREMTQARMPVMSSWCKCILPRRGKKEHYSVLSLMGKLFHNNQATQVVHTKKLLKCIVELSVAREYCVLYIVVHNVVLTFLVVTGNRFMLSNIYDWQGLWCFMWYGCETLLCNTLAKLPWVICKTFSSTLGSCGFEQQGLNKGTTAKHLEAPNNKIRHERN